MSVDFFNNNCTEPERKDKQYGICDDQDGNMAYSSLSTEEEWIAIIKNDNETEISFTPIDNCIIILKDGTKDKESTCDGMLTFKNSLYLLELKNRATGGWIGEAKDQLENTIGLISKNHDLKDIKYKKAFACNKKHPSFTVIEAAERKSFFERTGGFRFDAQAEIVIK